MSAEEHKTKKPFRNSASFGKRMEHYIIGRMLKDGLDVFLPVVDDDAIDAVVKLPDGRGFVEVQIKARSNQVKEGYAALFAAIEHEYRDNYWFVFYSERLEKIWLMSSQEFIDHSHQNKTGKNIGTRVIWFNGSKNKKRDEYVKPQFERFVIEDFGRILREDPSRKTES